MSVRMKIKEREPISIPGNLQHKSTINFIDLLRHNLFSDRQYCRSIQMTTDSSVPSFRHLGTRLVDLL